MILDLAICYHLLLFKIVNEHMSAVAYERNNFHRAGTAALKILPGLAPLDLWLITQAYRFPHHDTGGGNVAD